MATRILGIDLGAKRIGIAISDPLNIIATGLPTIERKNQKKDIIKIKEIVAEYGVSKIIMGLPINMDGSEGVSAKLAINFAEALRNQSLTVELMDERLSTQQGERVLIEVDMSRKKRKKNIDKIAAQLILQSYLDSLKKHV